MRLAIYGDQHVTKVEIEVEKMTEWMNIEAIPDETGEDLEKRVQTAFDEQYNRPEKNAERRFWRKVSDNSGWEIQSAARRIYDDGYADTCKKLRKFLKPDQAELIIAMCIDGMKVRDYAAKVGERANNISHRLCRAKKNLMESSFFDGCHGY